MYHDQDMGQYLTNIKDYTMVDLKGYFETCNTSIVTVTQYNCPRIQFASFHLFLCIFVKEYHSNSYPS